MTVSRRIVDAPSYRRLCNRGGDLKSFLRSGSEMTPARVTRYVLKYK
jgi:hypothetical protein